MELGRIGSNNDVGGAEQEAMRVPTSWLPSVNARLHLADL